MMTGGSIAGREQFSAGPGVREFDSALKSGTTLFSLLARLTARMAHV
jgi:hypothetical protein